jgi:hypothetical protein
MRCGPRERQRGYTDATKATWGHLVDNLLSEIEPTLIQPTFVYDYPVEISPLAKQKADDPSHVERFELFVGGMELANAFTELNDPFEQEQRFLQQGRAYAEGDEEAQPMDEDYLNAMKYGMPPPAALAWASTGWRCSSPTTTPSARCCSTRTCVRANSARRFIGSGVRALPHPCFCKEDLSRAASL